MVNNRFKNVLIILFLVIKPRQSIKLFIWAFLYLIISFHHILEGIGNWYKKYTQRNHTFLINFISLIQSSINPIQVIKTLVGFSYHINLYISSIIHIRNYMKININILKRLDISMDKTTNNNLTSKISKHETKS